MDHFKSIISTLLEADGYWVRRSFKVNVTKEEKRQIGKHSIPRPEIDLLAFHFSSNKVFAVEAKSFLDSPGVNLSQLGVIEVVWPLPYTPCSVSNPPSPGFESPLHLVRF